MGSRALLTVTLALGHRTHGLLPGFPWGTYCCPVKLSLGQRETLHSEGMIALRKPPLLGVFCLEEQAHQDLLHNVIVIIKIKISGLSGS